MLLSVDSAFGRREWSAEELRGLASAEAAQLAGRWGGEGDAVRVAAVLEASGIPPGVTHATFHAVDGYAASIPLGQAVEDGVLVVPPPASGRVGVRLVVSQGSTTCLNVKAVTRLELTAGPGKHTVDPNPHTPARVAGWDVP